MKNRVVFLVFVLLAAFASVEGQHHTESKDETLRGSGRVNPSTLGLEIDIPLAAYKGRGSDIPVSLSYSSKLWRMKNYGLRPAVNRPNCYYALRADYSENTASGWTSSQGLIYVEYIGESDLYDGFGAPLSNDDVSCRDIPPADTYIKRIQIHLSSGESHELRASDAIFPYDMNHPLDMTGTYYAVDGSNLKYVDDGGGTYRLYLPNGSYYDFAGTKTSLHQVPIRKATRFVDRNGNLITYFGPGSVDENGVTHSNGYWKDMMGRNISIPLGLEAPSAPGEQTYQVPGIATPYTFVWKLLKGVTPAESGLTDFYQPEYALFSSDGDYWVTGYEVNGTVVATFNPVVLTEVRLPNGQKYQFSYNSHAEIEVIHYPTGGKEEFVHQMVAAIDPPEVEALYPSPHPYFEQNRGVVERKIYENTSSTPNLWTYSTGFEGAGFKVTTNAPDLTRSEKLLHRSNRCTTCGGDWGFGFVLAGMPYEERQFNSNGQLLSKNLTTWTKTEFNIASSYKKAEWHPRVTNEESIIYDLVTGNALSTSTTKEYDGNLNQIDNPLNVKMVHQYGFTTTPGSLGTLAITQETDYSYDVNYLGKNLRSLPVETRIKDAGGTIKAKSQIDYDQANYLEGVTVTNAPGWENPNTTYRGLSTSTRTWTDVAANQYVETHALYDQFGNVRKTWDGRGNVSEVQYNDNFSDGVNRYTYAFPTKTISADPDGSGGPATSLETTVKYDFSTGLTTSTTDANGLETRMEYVDPLLRPTKVSNYYNNQQVGGANTTEYGSGTSAPTRFVKVRSQIDADKWKEGYTWFDGLGRTIKSQSVDLAGDVFVETEYDNMGRAKRSTNPYRNGETVYWTENTFDTAGRHWKVTTPDGAVVETTYGLATGSQIGTVVTVKDQAENLRRSITNARGQLVRVDEPTSAGLGAIDAPNQPTLYSYDLLNNLTTVQQNGSGTEQCGPAGGTCAQTRTFQYDSLSRLKSATNPESGTINYGYDLNGNLTSKSDARGVKSDYVYDALNRVTNRNYSLTGATPPNYQATSNVTYTYDNLPNAKGRLIKVTNGSGLDRSTTEYVSFDILGRVTRSKQTTDGVVYGDDANPMTYTYNLSGALIEEKYPSGRVVKNSLDASGDLMQVQSRKVNDTFHNYANGFTYNPAGAVTAMHLGNGKWESTQFNSRLQPTQIALGATAGDTGSLKLDYVYGTTQNNGNVLSQTITVNRSNQSPLILNQTYVYDSLNRLKSADEKPNGVTQQQCDQTPSLCWKQAYTFDRYGNRNFDQANTSQPVSFANPSISNPGIDSSNNKFTTGQGWSYDAAGNVITDAEGRTFFYDSENKQKEVRNSSSAMIGQYFFDGDGKRVKKVVPSTGETTIFVYDAGGKLVAEYSTSVLPQNDAKAQYQTLDNLGTPRINTDQNGNVVSRTDYMPYGEEVIALGGRSASDKYVADDVRQGFTGYIDDAETELDFAQARMYARQIGRFNGSDPLLSSGKPQLPQSWNRYGYTLNNPLMLVDPSGLYVCDSKTTTTKQCEQFEAALQQGRDNLKKIGEKYGVGSTKYQKAERALAVYGKAGEKNGVVIFSVEGAGAGRTDVKGYTAPKTAANPSGQKIVVQFDPEAFDQDNFDNLIAHEGSHAADGSEWVKSGFKDRANPTRYQTESDAYTVQSLFAESKGKTASYLITRVIKPVRVNLPTEIWNSSWAAADVDTLRKNNINFHLEFDREYGLTSKDKKKAF